MIEVENVYEKFKHLDKLLSDPLTCAKIIAYLTESPSSADDKMHKLACELWQAIKAEVKK